ncbi:hypothetical protein V1478_017880 [Vespula squamosa]|uniref:Uncharacterized protein n=1 Tax=Vespula squamosa TaxID=30214 RepID=A0ABD1ZW57_VESSQ
MPSLAPLFAPATSPWHCAPVMFHALKTTILVDPGLRECQEEGDEKKEKKKEKKKKEEEEDDDDEDEDEDEDNNLYNKIKNGERRTGISLCWWFCRDDAESRIWRDKIRIIVVVEKRRREPHRSSARFDRLE